MPSHLDTLPSSSRPPTTRSAATLASDMEDRKTLAAALEHADHTNISRECYNATSTFISRTMEGFHVIPKPKVGRTAQHHPAFTANRDTQVGIEENYTKASRVAGALIETTHSLLSALNNPTTQDENGNNDEDTRNTKPFQDLLALQSSQFFTLQSQFTGGFNRAPDCLAEIMSMRPGDRASLLQAITLCETIRSHKYALSKTVDREFNENYGKETTSRSYLSNTEDGDEEKSTKSES